MLQCWLYRHRRGHGAKGCGASRGWKWPGTNPALRPPEEPALRHAAFSPVRPVSNVDHTEVPEDTVVDATDWALAAAAAGHSATFQGTHPSPHPTPQHHAGTMFSHRPTGLLQVSTPIPSPPTSKATPGHAHAAV